MAKTTVDGGLPAAADELKRELQRTVNWIVEEDDYSLEATDRAMQCLCALKELKLKPNSTSSPPHEFVCPLSRQLMKDPVVLASGQVGFNLSSLITPFVFSWVLSISLINLFKSVNLSLYFIFIFVLGIFLCSNYKFVALV